MNLQKLTLQSFRPLAKVLLKEMILRRKRIMMMRMRSDGLYPTILIVRASFALHPTVITCNYDIKRDILKYNYSNEICAEMFINSKNEFSKKGLYTIRCAVSCIFPHHHVPHIHTFAQVFLAPLHRRPSPNAWPCPCVQIN